MLFHPMIKIKVALCDRQTPILGFLLKTCFQLNKMVNDFKLVVSEKKNCTKSSIVSRKSW